MFENFHLAKYEVVLEAGQEGLILPPYKGSTLRGGFGSAFKRLVCFQKSPGTTCHECLLVSNCPYSFIFESSPPPDAKILRNYRDIPRPFILEPPLDSRTYYPPGEKLIFHLVLIGKSIQYLPYFILVFREMANRGIGKKRLPAVIREVNAVNAFSGEKELIYPLANGAVRSDLDLSVQGQEILDRWSGLDTQEVQVEFVTMTRLKFEEALSDTPEFHIIIRHLLRRVSTLLAFYHDCRMEVNFKELIEAAQKIKLVDNQTRWVDWERYSNRQQNRMLMGGILGTARYEGEIGSFVPLLKLAELIHIGKSVVFGMGKVEVADFKITPTKSDGVKG